MEKNVNQCTNVPTSSSWNWKSKLAISGFIMTAVETALGHAFILLYSYIHKQEFWLGYSCETIR